MEFSLPKRIKRIGATLSRQGPQRYMPLRWRLVIAVPVAVLMVVVGKRLEWIIALFTKHTGLLLISTLGSYVIVIAVAGFAHWANRWLDVHVDWHKDFRNRLFSQIIMALLGAWILSVLMAILLFSFFGTTIHDAGYLRFEVWIVLFLLVSLNAGYAFWYHKQQLPPAEEEVFLDVKKANGEKLRVSERNVGFIQAANGHRLVRMIDSELYFSAQSIIELATILSSHRFYKLNRKHIINRAIIGRLVTDKRKRKDEDTGAEATIYRWVLNFGNDEMGWYKEKLVKGTVKHFEAWWKANTFKKNK